MIELINDLLNIKINPKGAELQSIFHQRFQLEYLWNGNPEYWGKHAPILFPIVGQLKENSFRHNHNSYSLPRHGFARDMEFSVVHQDNISVVFELKSNDETKQHYPFSFSFQIKYSLDKNQLTNEYAVYNNGEDALFFSVGGHPAFNIPLVANSNYEDYYLELEKKETIGRWKLQDGLLKTHTEPFLQNNNIIQLHNELFKDDAIVLKHLQSEIISIKSNCTNHGLTMHFKDFPYFGIWASKDAPFVCLEPWCGIADSLYHNQELALKEGIIKLLPNTNWQRSWSVTFF